MIKYYMLTSSFPLLIPLWRYFCLTFSVLSNWLVTVPDEKKNWKLYSFLSLDGWVLFWLFSWEGPNAAPRSGVMAFSEVWQGGSSCCIVPIADWGGRGNVISDWSVARVGWKFDVCRPLGLGVCRGKRKGKDGSVPLWHTIVALCVGCV